MLIATPQITWHGGENGKNDPLLSADVHLSCGVLATGGADADVRVWTLRFDNRGDDQNFQEFLYSLEGHSRSVNVVRFSPSGRMLATASDGGTIVIFTMPDRKPLRYWTNPKAKRFIKTRHVRTTQEDIYDLCWSPTSLELASASVDNKVMVWESNTGKGVQAIQDHAQFVQGVAWDPRGKYLASESNDRSVRVYHRRQKTRGKAAAEKSDVPCMFHPKDTMKFAARAAPLQEANGNSEETKESSMQVEGAEGGEGTPAPDTAAIPPPPKRGPNRAHLYADETIPSFFRRLAWSPDGKLLVTPTGLHRPVPDAPPTFVTSVYVRDHFDRPALVLPHMPKASVAVRFCPQLFRLRSPAPGQEPSNLMQLPYRLVFAVLTVDSIFVYDTQHHYPIVVVKKQHYAPLTDVAWVNDGSALIATSMDGYLSTLLFENGELGQPLDIDSVPEVVKSTLAIHYNKETAAEEEEEEEEKEKEEKEQDEKKEKAEPEAKAGEREERVTKASRKVVVEEEVVEEEVVFVGEKPRAEVEVGRGGGRYSLGESLHSDDEESEDDEEEMGDDQGDNGWLVDDGDEMKAEGEGEVREEEGEDDDEADDESTDKSSDEEEDDDDDEDEEEEKGEVDGSEDDGEEEPGNDEGRPSKKLRPSPPSDDEARIANRKRKSRHEDMSTKKDEEASDYEGAPVSRSLLQSSPSPTTTSVEGQADAHPTQHGKEPLSSKAKKRIAPTLVRPPAPMAPNPSTPASTTTKPKKRIAPTLVGTSNQES